MKIKQLELAGFKSFLDKTKFEFNAPITAIVGPNGCGKSNVVDALKWITGEMSFKELRGRAMEDLIFAGSDKRAPTSMMEVSLVLDNEGRTAPAQFNEYAEITLQRRIFRDGSSEFFINKVPCRLRDITDLFLDTGIGQSSYSIIEQGKVGAIVSGRPEDRRLMIEEAAGITKFKSRKKAAERKIEYTRQNLLRVTDIVQELKKQISSLERQAKKAEDYRKTQSKLQEVDLMISAKDYEQLRIASAESSNIEAVQLDLFTKEETVLMQDEALYETQRLSLDDIEKSLREAQNELFARKGSLTQIMNSMENGQRDIERLGKSIESENQKIQSLTTEIEKAEIQIKQTTEKIGLLEAQIQELSSNVAHKQTGWEEAKNVLAQLEKELETNKKSHLQSATREAQLSSSLESNQRQQAGIREEISQLQNSETELAAQISEKQIQYEEKKKNLDNASQLSFSFAESQKATKGKLELLEKEKSELDQELSAVQKRLDSQKSKLHALQEFTRSYQGYTKTVQGIMKNRQQLGGIHGVLGEMLRPKKGFEKIIQASLADVIECVVVDSPVDASKSIEFLKADQKSRGLFLVSRDPSDREAPRPKSDKILGTLLDFVEGQSHLHNSIKKVLSSIFVIQGSFEDLYAIWSEHPHDHFVNLEGDFISREGVIQAGPWSETRGDLEVRQQIEDLQAEIEPLVATRDELALKLNQVVRDISQNKHELQNINQNLEQQSRLNLDLTREAEKLLNSIEFLRQKTSDAKLRKEKIQQSVNQLAESYVQLDEERKTVSEAKKVSEEQMASLQNKLLEAKALFDQRASDLNASKVTIATSKERLDGLKRDLQNVTKILENSTRDRDRNIELVQTHQNQIVVLQEKIRSDHTLRDETLNLVHQQEEINSSLQTRHDAAAEGIRHLETKIKNARHQKDALNQQINDIRMKINEQTLRMESVRASIQERYQVDLLAHISGESVLIDDEEYTNKKAELDSLKDRLSKFGNVNLAAIEEVEQLKQRHEFLNVQKEDLEVSLQSLTEAIRKINRTTREKFETTFQEVNQRFERIFPRLFRGGKARLNLTDPENMLETGVDILAQPPGKKLQNMNLLSGGEKALTAIALLFAIFEFKAPPFCVLDEVDAPLDDANVLRFVSIVKEMSQKTQFIVVTHNKNTMEMAHNLYGVTMEEPGLSRVVSVRLHQDIAAQATDPLVEARNVA